MITDSKKSLASDYADSLLETIQENCMNGTPFGYYDGSEGIDGEEVTAMDYLSDALDIIFKVTIGREYKSASILIGWGGLHVYVDTGNYELRVHWGYETEIRTLPEEYIDALNEALADYWAMH